LKNYSKILHPLQIKKANQSSLLLMVLFLLTIIEGCYSFRDVSIPPEVKTVKVNYIENRARIINPQLSQRLTDKLRQKIINQTRLSQTNSNDAHYDISGQITDYYVTTSGISGQRAATNRLNVGIRIIVKNRLDQKKDFEADLTRNFDFDATLSLQQAENQLTELVVQNFTDEIFNRIFSNW
jgi:tRNA U34 5-carboxymethylaminomethyl modifying GTPase MnmE/TrmE